MKKIDVMLVDDHVLFREGLASIIKSFHFIGNIFEASDSKELFEKLKSNRPDVIILDLELPGLDGLEIIKILSKHEPFIKILVLTMYESDELIGHLLSLGVNGYLVKNVDVSDIKKALFSLIENDIYYDNKIVKVMRNMIRKKPTAGITTDYVSFSSRENKILKLICREFTNKKIAMELDLSERTVEKIRGNLISITGSNSTVGLIKYAYVHKLVIF